MTLTPGEPPEARTAYLDMSPDDFRTLGYRLVDRIAEFLGGLSDRPVTPGETPAAVRTALGGDSLPRHGSPPGLFGG